MKSDHALTMAVDESPEVESVLRALADPTRRRLFVLLGDQPGLTTTQLGDRVQGITRWGVIKHLEVLRSAGLIQTLADGRRRRHYRENAPLQALHDWLNRQRLG